MRLIWSTGSNKRVLPLHEASLMLHLIELLDIFVGKKSGIFKKTAAAGVPVDANVFRKEIRDYWYNDLSFIDQFIKSKDGKKLTGEQRQIILSWKHVIYGEFLYIKNYAEFAVFRPMSKENSNYYAVLGITDDFSIIIPYKPLCMITTALLPYKDVIIWDGLVGIHSILFGKSISSTFIQECKQFKKENRIVFQIQREL